jgi:DNA-binding IclR family transcriptional regulator
MRSLTTLVKGLKVLEAVAALEVGSAVGAREIADLVGMERTTVYGYLYTLQEAGYLSKIGEGSGARYKIGSRIVRLAGHYLDNLDLRRQASPVLADLVAKTGLTAHLAVLDEGRIIYLDKAEPDSPIQMRSSIGASAPAYCTAAGKSMLAYLPKSRLEEEVLNRELVQRTPNTWMTLNMKRASGAWQRPSSVLNAR